MVYKKILQYNIMDKQVQSEKERLAARIAELEARLTSVRIEKGAVRATDDAVQTYGDYKWSKEDKEHKVSQADIYQAVLDRADIAAGKSVDAEFKYAMSPDERRRPKDLRATSWAGADGKRVLDEYEKVFKSRKAGEKVSDVGNQKWVEEVGVNTEESLSSFHDWQVKVYDFSKEDDAKVHNNSLSSDELEGHLNAWTNKNGNLNSALKAEEDEVKQLAHIEELKAMIALGEEKTISVITLVDSKNLLNELIKKYNVLTADKALYTITTFMGIPGKFLQARLGSIENKMKDIIGFKDVGFHLREDAPTADCPKIEVDGKIVGGNFLNLDSARYGSMVQPATNNIDAHTKFYTEDYKLGRIDGPILSVSDIDYKNKKVWLVYTAVTKTGIEYKGEESVVVGDSVEKKRGIVYGLEELRQAGDAAIVATDVVRKTITKRSQVIRDLQTQVSPLDWYKAQAQRIDFDHLHYTTRIPHGTDLRDADFEGSDLTGVEFVECDIRGVNFKDCVIVNTSFRACVWDSTTIFPLGFGDVVPDYFSVEPKDNNLIGDDQDRPWFTWENYIGSVGSHDPSGNLNNGTWDNATGVRHWVDQSKNTGALENPSDHDIKTHLSAYDSLGKKRVASYIQNSSVRRLSEAMKSELHDTGDKYGEVGTRLNMGNAEIKACIGAPPKYVVKSADGSVKEYFRGAINQANTDISRCYEIPNFFTKESATMWGASTVTITPMLQLLGTGNVGHEKSQTFWKFDYEGVDAGKKVLTWDGNTKPQTNVASVVIDNIGDTYNTIIFEEHGEWTTQSNMKGKTKNAVNRYPKPLINEYRVLAGLTLFKEETIVVKPVTSFSETLKSKEPCPEHRLQYTPMGSTLPSNTPYNVIFGFNNNDPSFDHADVRKKMGRKKDGKRFIPEIKYISAYNVMEGDEFDATNNAGKKSVEKVKSFLKVAQYPTFNTNGTDEDQMFKEFNTITVNGESVNRFHKYPIKDMQYANFEGAKFNYIEFNDADSKADYTESAAGVVVTKEHVDAVLTQSGRQAEQSKFFATYFKDVELNNAVFKHADLRKCVFDGCNLSDVDFSGADIRGATFLNCSYNGASFREVIGNDDTIGTITNSDAAEENIINRGGDTVRFFNPLSYESNKKLTDVSANFLGANLYGVEFAGLNLGGDHSKANMQASIFYDTKVLGKDRKLSDGSNGATLNGSDNLGIDYRYSLHQLSNNALVAPIADGVVGDEFIKAAEAKDILIGSQVKEVLTLLKSKQLELQDKKNDHIKSDSTFPAADQEEYENIDAQMHAIKNKLRFPLGKTIDVVQKVKTREPSLLERAKAGDKQLQGGDWSTDYQGNDNVMDLSGLDLTNACLDGSDFESCVFWYVDFTNASMVDCSFNNTKLYNSKCLKTRFNRSYFVGADISGLIQNDELLPTSTLEGADFGGCDFKDASIVNMNVTKTNFVMNTTLDTKNENMPLMANQWPGTWFYNTLMYGFKIKGADGNLVDLTSSNQGNDKAGAAYDDNAPLMPYGFEYAKYTGTDDAIPFVSDLWRTDAKNKRNGPTIFQQMKGSYTINQGAHSQNVDVLYDVSGINITNMNIDAPGDANGLGPLVFSSYDGETGALLTPRVGQTDSEQYRIKQNVHIFWNRKKNSSNKDQGLGEVKDYKGMISVNNTINGVKFDRLVLPKADFEGTSGIGMARNGTVSAQSGTGTTFVNIQSWKRPQDDLNGGILKQLELSNHIKNYLDLNTPVNESAEKLEGEDLLKSVKISFKNANLAGTAGAAGLSVFFNGSYIPYTDFTGADLQYAVFGESGSDKDGVINQPKGFEQNRNDDATDWINNRCILTGSNFQEAKLQNTNFYNATIDKCDFTKNLTLKEQTNTFNKLYSAEGCKFVETDLSGIVMGASGVNNILNMKGSNFTKATLFGATFNKVDFGGANSSGDGTIFGTHGSPLSLEQVVFNDCVIEYSDLRFASFNKTKINNYDKEISEQTYSTPSVFGIKWPVGYYHCVPSSDPNQCDSVFNYPSNSEATGGFTSAGLLNPPLAEILLANGVYDMNKHIVDGEISNPAYCKCIAGETGTHTINGIHLDYQAPPEFAYVDNDTSGTPKESPFWTLKDGSDIYEWHDKYLINDELEDMGEANKSLTKPAGMRKWIEYPELYEREMRIFKHSQAKKYQFIKNHWADESMKNPNTPAEYTENEDDANRGYGHKDSGYLVHRKPIFGVEPIRIDSKNSDANGVKWEDCDIFGVDFKGSNFIGGTFTNCHFYDCIFDNCSMNNITMESSQFDTCSFKNAILSPSDAFNPSTLSETVMIDCDFANAKFVLAHLNGINLSNCHFDNTDFTDAYLQNVAVAKVVKANSIYEDKTAYTAENSNGRRELWDTLDEAFKDIRIKTVDMIAHNTPGDLKSYEEAIQKVGQLPPIDDSTAASKESTRLAYKNKVIEIQVRDAKIEAIRKAAQEEEKRYLQKPKAVNMPNRNIEGATNKYETLHNINTDDIAYSKVKTAMKKSIKGIKGGSFHSDFKETKFKNTLFKNFSIDGNTEDLHGLDCCLLPLGFLHKLWNNKIDPSGSLYESDASGNMERVFEYAGFWDYNNKTKESQHKLGGAQAKLPALESVFGIYDLSKIQVYDATATLTNDLVYDDTTTQWEYLTSEQQKMANLPAGVVKYHKPQLNGWYPLLTAKESRTTINSNIDTKLTDDTRDDWGYDLQGTGRNKGVGRRRTNNCGFDDFGAAAELHGKDDKGARRLDGPTFRERFLARVRKFNGNIEIGRQIDVSGNKSEEKNISRIGYADGSTIHNRIDLSGVILSGADFSSKNYFADGKSWSNATITGIKAGVDITKKEHLSSDLYTTGDEMGLQLALANLTNVNFAGADLTNANLEGAILRGAILHDTSLNGVNLMGADLTGAQLLKTQLANCVIGKSDLTGEYTKFRDSGIDINEGAGRNYPDNALEGRYELSEAHFWKVNTKEVGNTNSSILVYKPAVNMWPYGMAMAKLTDSTDANHAKSLTGDFSNIKYTLENLNKLNNAAGIKANIDKYELGKAYNLNEAKGVDLLRSGKPLLGGIDFTTGYYVNDISYSAFDTTGSNYFASLKPEVGRTFKNARKLLDFGGETKKPTYDTLWNWTGDKNNADLRQIYLSALIDTRTTTTSNIMKINSFPPNHVWMEDNVKKGGNLMIWDENLFTPQQKTDYNKKNSNVSSVEHFQPRYDLSVPTGSTPTKLDSCDLSNVVMPYTNFINVSARSTKFNGAMLRGCDFSGADLESVDFSFIENGDDTEAVTRTDLVRTNFENANLINANFIGANLAYADFSGAKIEGCKFWGANIAHADFTNADFGTGANFIGAGPFYYIQPGNSDKLRDKTNGWSDQVTQDYLDSEYWTLAEEDIYTKYEYGKDYTDENGKDSNKTNALKALGYWENVSGLHTGWPSLGVVGSEGRLVFSFMNEALMNPKALIHDEKLLNKSSSETTSEEARIQAHKNNILMEVMPKFPKGFNTMAALGWERDISGVITPHFRRTPQFISNNSSEDDGSFIYKPIIDAILANNAILAPDAGFIDIRPNNVFGNKNNTLKNVPMVRYNDQALAGTAIATINTLEHGDGLNNATQEVYLKTQTQLSCNKYETLSEPISDLSGVVYKKTAGGNAYANFNYVDFTCNNAYTQMHFKHSDLGAEGGDATGVTFVGATFPSTTVASDGTPATVDSSRNTVFENCSLNKVDFSGASLIGADFSTTITIEGTKFHGADLTGADFSGVDLTDVEFTNAWLSQAGLSATQKAQAGNIVYNANLTNVNFKNAVNPHAAKWPMGMDISMVMGIDETLNRGDPITVNEKIAAGQRVWVNTNFSKADIITEDLNATPPRSATDFSGANLSGCVFESATLTSNPGATKTWDVATGVSLKGVDFSGADLTDVVFTGVDLAGAIFTNSTKFNRTVFVDARNPKKAQSWPQGFAYDIAVINNEEHPDDLNWNFYCGPKATTTVVLTGDDETENKLSRTWESLWYTSITTHVLDVSNSLVGPLAATMGTMDISGQFSLHDMSSNNPTVVEKALGYPRVKLGTQLESVAAINKTADKNIITNLFSKNTNEVYSGNSVIAPRIDNSANFISVNMEHIDFAQESFRNKTYAGGATETLQILGSRQGTGNDVSANLISSVPFAVVGQLNAVNRYQGALGAQTITLEWDNSSKFTPGSEEVGAWSIYNSSTAGGAKPYFYKQSTDANTALSVLKDNTIPWKNVTKTPLNGWALHDRMGNVIPPTTVVDITKLDNTVYDLSGANVRGASFYNADLSGVNFEFCAKGTDGFVDLRDCDFTGADLTQADFSGCNINGAVFYHAKIKDTSFNDTRDSHEAYFPAGFDFKYKIGGSTYDYTNVAISVREFLGALRGWNNTSSDKSWYTPAGATYISIPSTAANGEQDFITRTEAANAEGGKSVWFNGDNTLGDSVDATTGTELKQYARTNLSYSKGPLRKLRAGYLSSLSDTTYDYGNNNWNGLKLGYNLENISIFANNGLNLNADGSRGPTLSSSVLHLASANLQNANLKNASFARSDIRGIDLRGADISGLDLSGALMANDGTTSANGPKISNCTVTPSTDGAGTEGDDVCNKPKTQFAGQNKSILGPSLSKGRESDPTFMYVCLNHLEANNVRFSDAGTSAATSYSFKQCSLIGAKFDNCDLRFVDFTDADLTGASFLGSDLSGAKFNGSIIFDTDFTESNMYETDFEGAFWNNGTSWPKGLISEADNVEANAISGTNHGTIRMLTQTAVPNATFKTRSLGTTIEAQYAHKKATLTFNLVDSVRRLKAGSVASKDDTISNILYTKACSSTFEEPTGVNFNFWNSAAVQNHVGWDISGSRDLSNIPQEKHAEGLFQSASFPEQPGRTVIVGGNSVEIKTRLDLSGADLSGVSLDNTNMKQSNLTNANMTHIDLSATDFTGADMMGAILHEFDASSNQGVRALLNPPTDGYVYFSQHMEKCDISAVDFSGVVFANNTDFSGSTIVDTSFNEAILINAIFDHCKIGSTSKNAVHMTTFENAETEKVSMVGADISHVDITGMNFGDIDLSGATVVDISFSKIRGRGLGQSIFDYADISASDLSGTAELPLSWNGSAIGTSFTDLSFTHVDLHNCAEMDFSGAKFKNVQFTKCDFQKVNFTNVDLSNADLSDCVLLDVNFHGADLSGVDMSACDLGQMDLSGVKNNKLHEIVLTRANLSSVNTHKNEDGGFKYDSKGRGNIKNIDLSGAKINDVNLHNFSFEGSTLRDVDLSLSDLSGIDFSGAILNFTTAQILTDFKASLKRALEDPTFEDTGVNFTNTTIHQQIFHDATVALEITDISRVSSFKDVSANDLNLEAIFVSPRYIYNGGNSGYNSSIGMDFSGATLRGLVTDATTNLEKAEFTNADLRGSVLAGKMGHAKLVGANLSKNGATATNLTGVDLSNADLSGADLTGANLTNVDLSNTDITNVDFSGANLSGVLMPAPINKAIIVDGKSVVVNTMKSFEEATLGAGGVVFDLSHSVIHGVSFKNTTLTNVDISNADLSGCDFSQSGNQGADFTRKGLVKAVFNGKFPANLNYCKFHDMSFAEIDLSGVGKETAKQELIKVEFIGSDLSGGVIFDGLTIKDCDFSGCDLSGASFRNCTLEGNSFDNANLTYVDFSGATLNQSKLTGGGFYSNPDAYPDTARLSTGYIDISGLGKATLNNVSFQGASFGTNKWIGRASDLSGINLSGIDMSGASHGHTTDMALDFSGANLTGANFTNCDLSATRFNYANLTGANFTNAKIKYCDFSGANVTLADFTLADISMALFNNTTISETKFENVKNAQPLVANSIDLHRVHTEIDGSIPDGATEATDARGFPVDTSVSIGFRRSKTNVIIDASGNRYRVNSVGHVGHDGIIEKDHKDIGANPDYNNTLPGYLNGGY